MAGPRNRRHPAARPAILLGKLFRGGERPGILANSAFVLAGLGEDIATMIGLIDRALALNPSFARGWLLSGFLRLWAGQLDLAIEHLETSLRLSPRVRMGMALSVMGQAYFLKRQFDAAASRAAPFHPRQPRLFPRIPRSRACSRIWDGSTKRGLIVRQLRTMTSQVVLERQLSAKPGASRTLSFGPAAGGRRGELMEAQAQDALERLQRPSSARTTATSARPGSGRRSRWRRRRSLSSSRPNLEAKAAAEFRVPPFPERRGQQRNQAHRS